MTRRCSWWSFLVLSLLCSLALVAPGVASANIKLVGTVASASGPVSGYSYVMPLQLDTVTNDTLVLIAANPGRQINAVADTEGNTWVKDVSNGSTSIWHAVETTALTLTKNDHITVSTSSPMSVNDAVVEELNGVDPAAPVDTTATQKFGSPGPSTITESVTASGNDDAFVDVASFLPRSLSGPTGSTILDGAWQFTPAVNPDLGPAGTYDESWSPGGTTDSTVRSSVLYRAFTAAAPTCSGNTPNVHEYVDGCPLYNAGSWVNSPLPANAPVDPNSASMAQVQAKTMDLNPDGSLIAGARTGRRWDESVSVYVSTSTDRSTWKTVCSSEVLKGTSWAWMDALHNAWTTFKAPVPSGTINTDGGSDNGYTLYDAKTGEMWDFYEWSGAAAPGTTDPQGHPCDYVAAGGDYQNDIANHPGYFQTKSLGSGVTENQQWGRRAAALPSAAGVITPDEWNNPLPDLGHTLQIIVGCADTSKQYWPATRHDGCAAGSGGLPEGARFRIPLSYTCVHGTAGPTGATQLAFDRAYSLCATLQKYGGIVTDQTGGGTAWTIAATYGDGKPYSITPDGGGNSGHQWPNWYWDVDLNRAMPLIQVIDQSYRPPYAPGQ